MSDAKAAEIIEFLREILVYLDAIKLTLEDIRAK